MNFICLISNTSCHILHITYQEPVTKVNVNLQERKDQKYIYLNPPTLAIRTTVVLIRNYYPHDGRAEKDSYPHDGRADKDFYPHDRHNQYIMLSL